MNQRGLTRLTPPSCACLVLSSVATAFAKQASYGKAFDHSICRFRGLGDQGGFNSGAAHLRRAGFRLDEQRFSSSITGLLSHDPRR